MDLPIFSDNLKSSGSWAGSLARARVEWDEARQSVEARERIEALTRREQVEQALRRAGRGINGQRLLEAAKMGSARAADHEDRVGVDRFLVLPWNITGAPVRRGTAACSPSNVHRRVVWRGSFAKERANAVQRVARSDAVFAAATNAVQRLRLVQYGKLQGFASG